MHHLRSPYTLLLFYNPDSQGCAEVLQVLKASVVLNHSYLTVTVLAFYSDVDHATWVRYQGEIPSRWVNCYDKDLTVMTEERYALKAMPTLYLLDKDKKVLLKDATIGEIEAYFEK